MMIPKGDTPLVWVYQLMIFSDHVVVASNYGKQIPLPNFISWLNTTPGLSSQAFGLMRQKMVFIISQEVMATHVLLFGQTTSPIRVGTNLLTYFMWSNPNPKKTKLLSSSLLFEAELWSFMWFTLSKSTALFLARGIDVLSKWFLGSQLILLLECEENLISPISLSHFG